VGCSEIERRRNRADQVTRFAAAQGCLAGGEKLSEIHVAVSGCGDARGAGVDYGEGGRGEQEKGENGEGAEDRFHDISFPADVSAMRPAP
jgi:hypothetical protein